MVVLTVYHVFLCAGSIKKELAAARKKVDEAPIVYVLI